MIEVIIKSLPVFIAIILGKIFVSRKLLADNAADVISAITFRLVGPFFVFNFLYGVSIGTENAYLVFFPFIVFLGILALSYSSGKYLLKLGSRQLGAMIICFISFGAGAVYPFVYRNFPESVFQSFIVLDMVSFFIFLTLGSLVASNLNKESRGSFRQMIFRSLKDPLLLTMVFTFLVTALRIAIPQAVIDISKYIGGSFFLLASLLVGMTLKIPSLESFKKIAGIYALRVIFASGLVFLFSALFFFDRGQVQPLYLVFLTQFSVLGVAYSKEQNLDYELASQLVLFSIVAQLILYPVLMAIL